MIEFENDKTGGCRFLLRSPSGADIFKSSLFDSELKARNIVQEISADPIIERKTNYQGKFVMDVRTKDGVLVGRSKTYTSEAGMENGIKNVTSILVNSSLPSS